MLRYPATHGSRVAVDQRQLEKWPTRGSTVEQLRRAQHNPLFRDGRERRHGTRRGKGVRWNAAAGGAHTSTASFGRSFDGRPPTERVGAGCARRGPPGRTAQAHGPLPARRGRATEWQSSKPAIWDGWIVIKVDDTWLALLRISQSHPGKGNALLRFRYFFCSGICSAVTRSVHLPVLLLEAAIWRQGTEEKLWRRHVAVILFLESVGGHYLTGTALVCRAGLGFHGLFLWYRVVPGRNFSR
jgi:hypothetical protein